LNFIKKIKLNFPFDKTVLIAALVSYWYLKSFLIDEMVKSLDYIVYMTYNLYSKCSGNCLIETTANNGLRKAALMAIISAAKTKYVLVIRALFLPKPLDFIITKAGVDSNKVFVGVPTYGRSFGITDESCTGPNRHYTGTNSVSNAKQGRYTKTAGIIANAEIHEILTIRNQTKSYYNTGSNSNIIASFIDSDTVKSRTSYYKDSNFGDKPPMPKLAVYTETFPSIEALGNTSSTIPKHCVMYQTVLTTRLVIPLPINRVTGLRLSRTQPDYSKHFIKNRDHPESIHWSLDDSKATTFWTNLYSNTRINQSHIQFGQYTRQKTCGPSAKSNNDCWKTSYNYNIPIPKGYNASEVSNPKDTAKKGLDRAGSLKPQISTALFQIATNT
ncbi:killer toxin alpha/beta, partial [Penicillium sp. CMV-2018d]